MAARAISIIGCIFLAWGILVETAHSQDFEDLFQTGVRWQSAGQPRKAVSAYEQALRIGDGSESNYEWAMAILGQVYSSLGQYDRAEKLLKQVIARWERSLAA